jgi:hypothetical protein
LGTNRSLGGKQHIEVQSAFLLFVEQLTARPTHI